MDNKDILRAILSKDTSRIAEAKGAIKALLDARATQFRADSTKFIAKSLFESVDESAEANESYDPNSKFTPEEAAAKIKHHEAKAKEHAEKAAEHLKAGNTKAHRTHSNAADQHHTAAKETTPERTSYSWAADYASRVADKASK